MGKYTDPTVLRHIWQGVKAFCDGETREDGVIYCKADERIDKCTKLQDKIGWDNLLYGRVLMQWEIVNRKLLKDREHRIDSTTWTVYLIRELYKIGVELWNAQNIGEHRNQSMNSLSLEARDNTITVIQQFYAKIKPVIRPQDSWLFEKSKKIKVREKFDNQIAWINLVGKICKSTIKDLQIEVPNYLVR